MDVENVVPQWSKEMNCAVTVCDVDGNIIYMNDKSIETFGNMVGQNMIGCHSERSQAMIRNMIATGGCNAYTIDKKGVKKMIYQTAWRENGVVRGLVEISMVIPQEMPHYVR